MAHKSSSTQLRVENFAPDFFGFKSLKIASKSLQNRSSLRSLRRNFFEIAHRSARSAIFSRNFQPWLSLDFETHSSQLGALNETYCILSKNVFSCCSYYLFGEKYFKVLKIFKLCNNVRKHTKQKVRKSQRLQSSSGGVSWPTVRASCWSEKQGATAALPTPFSISFSSVFWWFCCFSN